MKPKPVRKTGKKRRTVSPRNGADVTATQFQPGGPGGPGRPRTAALREQICASVDEAGGLAAIVTTMVRRAKAGDVSAARLLFDFMLPKPVAEPEPLAQEIRFIWEDPPAPQQASITAPPNLTAFAPVIDASVDPGQPTIEEVIQWPAE